LARSLLSEEGEEGGARRTSERLLADRSFIILVGEERGKKITMSSSSHTRRWDIDNPNEQIRAANKELRTRLMAIVTRRNLTPQLPGDETSSSVSDIVDVLIHNGVIPNEGRSRQSAQIITAMGERVDRGELITPIEFGNGTYTNAIEWFDILLPDIER
jgi:hypothetical protein